MPSIFANLIADWTSGQWFRTPVRPMLGFMVDTRTLKPGQVFVALKTDKRDGHDFLPTVEQAGTGMAIVEDAAATQLPAIVVHDARRAAAVAGLGGLVGAAAWQMPTIPCPTRPMRRLKFSQAGSASILAG